MKNLNLLFVLLLLLTISCKDKEDIESGVAVEFFPRECNYVWTDYVKQIEVNPNGQTGYILEDIYDNKCKIENFRLLIFTSNIDTLLEGRYSAITGPCAFHQHIDEEYQDLDNHNITLEKQLEDDFRRTLKSSSSNSLDGINLLPWEYRTTGISELTITCNKTIFKQDPGVSLNSFFHITSLEPHQIISNDTKELIFGCSDNLNKMSIEEWLDMKPMAQPSMGLLMNYIPDELPGDFIFTVKLTTNTGLEIESSGREIQLLP